MYVDPADYIHNWHIDAICDHLEAITNQEILRLLITIPPRHMKSISVSVAWPAWSWIKRPEIQFLFSSYAGSLSIRDSVKCRRLIQSPLYQARWGQNFSLTSDQNAKQRYDNNHGGYRLATSVDGALTGEGGDILVVDDPHNVREVESDVVRQSVIDWWKEAMSTRLNSMETGAKVIIQQRTHELDLAGYVLEHESDWVHLNLPAEHEKTNRCKTVLPWEDPRKEEGELLYPERFSRKAIIELTETLGIYGSSAQLQQRPVPRGGSMFEAEMFEIVPAMPAECYVIKSIRYWDKAGTQDGGKRTAGVLMHKLRDGRQVISDVKKGQWDAFRREKIIKNVTILDGHDIEVWVEQEPGSGGKESAESTIRNLAGYSVYKERVTGDKEVRAEPYAVQVNAGNVMLVKGDWTKDFIKEHEIAPRGTFKDQWDAAGGAFNKLNTYEKEAGVWGR